VQSASILAANQRFTTRIPHPVISNLAPPNRQVCQLRSTNPVPTYNRDVLI
jgi:hypothetical protein